MRKGQEKLIKRAEELLPKEFVEKLMDESFTIEQLESLFSWMLLFKDYPEILDDWDAFCQDAFSFKHIYAITGDWRRTYELCTYMREKFHDCRYYVMDDYWQAFAYRIYSAEKDDQYLFNKDDMTHILDYIRDHILCNDYSDCKSSENFLGVSDEFSDYSDFMYKFIKVNSGIGLALVLIEEGTCSKDMDEILRIIRLTSRMVNGGMEARARCYIKAGITDEEWIQYEQMIENNVFNRNIVAAEIAFKYYPGFKDLVDSIMERNDASLYFISNELGNGYSSGRINLTNTEFVEPIFNTCTKLDCAEFGSENIVSVNEPAIKFSWKITFSGIFLTFRKYESTAIYNAHSRDDYNYGDEPLYSCRHDGRTKLARTYLFTNDYNVLMQIPSGKWVPAGFHTINNDVRKGCGLIGTILSWFFQRIKDAKECVWKDIMAYSVRDYDLLPAFTCNEITAGYTLNEVMNTHYKNAGFIDWSRCDLRLGYLIMQALPLVNEKSRNFLLANKYMSFEEFMKTYCVHAKRIYIDPEIKRVDSRRYVVKRFLFEIIQKRIGADIDPIIYDYIDMSEMLHRKISIMFTSEKKVNDAHDDLAKELTAKNTPRVKVPKNSKFNRLAKLLPDNMEWIKSKKRLVQEGSEMHNCVAEYANKINKDSCAIYSFVYNNKRYTVEFVAYKNRYSIKQLYGVCNSEPEAGVEDYVKGFLAE